MKKYFTLILSFAIVCMTAATLSACSVKSKELFVIPNGCCIVSTNGSCLIAAKDNNATCELIETEIKDFEDDGYNHYCVTVGATVNITCNGSGRWGNIGKTYTQQILTGYEIDGELIESNGYGEICTAEYTVNGNCLVKGVYEYYSDAGIFFVEKTEAIGSEYYNVDNYLDENGNIKNTVTANYIFYNGGNFYERESWETNLSVNYFGCIYRPFPNSEFPNVNQYHQGAWAGYVASLTVGNFLDDEDNDKTVSVSIGKTDGGKYFVEAAVDYIEGAAEYGIDLENVCMHLFMGNNFLELYFAN